uniref:Uncharacterized protein n=1 Tax=Kalanchoe fedtschenkoi TaxID=63787 RepID=A0A7N0TCZ7_KALFE
MRCRIHASDSTSTVGVCATCLRHRLLSLVAAQPHRSHHHLHSASPRRKSDFDHHQQPFLFPRSVSPYVPRGSKLHHAPLPEPRFYSTPQIGHPPANHKHRGRFSFISSLFRPRSDKSDFGLEFPRDPRETTSTATTTSSSWFSSIRRRHKSKPPKTTSGHRLPRGVVVLDRGMTPERMSCADGSEFDEPRIDFMSDSCKRTPARSAKPGSNMSGMAFCMSPLVRASPARLWNQKSAPTDIVGYSGEIRSVGYPNLSTASSYCANRSRKLADFGRVSHRH